jgi:hypothetical protein
MQLNHSLKMPALPHPVSLKCDILASHFAFKLNLYRCSAAPGGGHNAAGGGAKAETDDLDAGCYHDDTVRADAGAVTTARRRAAAADFSRGRVACSFA